MKLIKRISNKETILLGVFFVLFTLSYTTNIFHISNVDLFHGFERQPEGLVVGRLARSAQDGVFSYGGLTGVNFDSKKDKTTEQYAMDLAAQHNLYLTNAELPDSYQAYKSQTGGQGILFGILQKISPLSNAQNLMLFRGLNALLIAFVFCLFARWIQLSFGFVASVVSLLLILFSPWLNVFSHNLWWILWSFYLPFITLTLALGYKHKYPNQISELKILVLLFLSVFLKCFFTGFEFITSALVAAICPIVYYFFLERRSLRQFICFSVKVSVVMLCAVLVQMALLVTQIKFLDGEFSDGINHILISFTKRSATESASLLEVLKMYLQDDAFSLGFLPNNFHIPFGLLLVIIIAICILIFRDKEREKKALAITSLFSLLGPLSWLIVFKQHSFEHPHMDYIIWYMPFLLYGFCVIGVFVSNILTTKNKEEINIS